MQQRAEIQGEVRIYSVAVPAQNDLIVDAFEKKYPNIDVTMVRGASELPARVDAEIQSNADGADVFLYFGQQWFTDNPDDLAPVDSPSTASYPADAWAVPGSAPVVSILPAGFLTWNTQIFPEGFKEWSDLTRPEVKGRLGMRGSVDLTVTAWSDLMEKVNGPEFLPALAAQQPRFYPSVVPLTQAVASGEVGVSGISTLAAVKDLIASGAPLAYTLPSEVWASVYIAAPLRNAKRPDAGRVFVDFLASPEGQAAFNGNEIASSPLPGIPGTVSTEGMTVLDSARHDPPGGRRFRPGPRAVATRDRRAGAVQGGARRVAGMTTPDRLGTVLGVWAHPDDEAYLSAGLMALARDRGERVVCVTATRGEHGTPDPARWPPEKLGPERTGELARSLALLGVHEHHWLGLPDGGCVAADLAPVERLVALIREVRPHTVVTFGPDGLTGHPDHRAVSLWTYLAFRRAAPPLARLWHAAMPEHRRRWESVIDGLGVYPPGLPEYHPSAQLVLDWALPPELAERKLAALLAQETQVGGLLDALGRDTYAAWVADEAFVEAAVRPADPAWSAWADAVAGPC